MMEGTDSPANPGKQENWPWWFRIGQKTACVIAGIVCSILGIFVCISFHALCIVAGVFQIMLGLLIIMLEAPCCCAYLDFIDKISKFSENRAAWQKAAVYCILPVIPIALCQGISSIVGCVLVFLAGLSYAYMAVGRKASRQDMLNAARESGDKSSLTNNAQPMAQSDINRIV